MWEAAVNIDNIKYNDYHAPKPFTAPSEELSLEQLFDHREFGFALKKSYTELEACDPPESDEELDKVLNIWLIRLKCLLCLKLGVQAAEEAAVCLQDLNSPVAAEKMTTLAIIWDLRLLLVPATAKGINQMAIQQYYSLGDAAKSMHDLGRLRSAGLYVAATLLSLRDYVTALDHLVSIYSSETDEVKLHVAEVISLVYLEVGDTLSAREWIPRVDSEKSQRLLELCTFSDGESSAHAGIANLYVGHVDQAIKDLEAKAPDRPIPTIANLLVLYDLQCSDSTESRRNLADHLVKQGCKSLESYAGFADFVR